MQGTFASWQGPLHPGQSGCKWVHNVGLGNSSVWLGCYAAWPCLCMAFPGYMALPGLGMSWPGLAWICLAWLGYGVAWPGYGVAWLGYGVPCLGMVWSGWVPMRAMNNLKILRFAPGQATTSPGQATPYTQARPEQGQARPDQGQAKPEQRQVWVSPGLPRSGFASWQFLQFYEGFLHISGCASWQVF